MGWTSECMSWETLASIIDDGSDETLAKLLRSKEVLDTYMDFLAKLCYSVDSRESAGDREIEIKEDYESVASFLWVSAFGCEWVLNADGKKKAVGVPPVQTEGSGPVILLKSNDFPYYFDEGIQHHILWSTEPLSPEEISKQIENRLEAVYPCSAKTDFRFGTGSSRFVLAAPM
eukprot:gene14090-20042_t